MAQHCLYRDSVDHDIFHLYLMGKQRQYPVISPAYDKIVPTYHVATMHIDMCDEIFHDSEGGTLRNVHEDSFPVMVELTGKIGLPL